MLKAKLAVLLTPFALALHTYRPANDRSTILGSVSNIEVVLPEVVRGPTAPAGCEVHVRLVPGVDVAEHNRLNMPLE